VLIVINGSLILTFAVHRSMAKTGKETEREDCQREEVAEDEENSQTAESEEQQR